MAKKWWEEPVRMLRVDYAPDFSDVKKEDLDALARRRRDDWGINCEWVPGSLGFDGCGHLTTFQSEHFEPCPGFEDFDILRSYVPHAHTNGIRVISYLNMHWYSYAFAEAHPGWEQIAADGETYGRKAPLYGNGTTLCVNAPWRDWAFQMMRDAMRTGIDGVFLDGPVIFPDCCYCSSCQEQFKAQHGAAIPKEDWADPLWRAFVDFREASMARFLADARTAVEEVNPEGVVFLNGGSWAPGSWRVARDMQRLAPHQQFSGAEAFFHYGRQHNDYHYMMAAKYLRAGHNPAVVFIHYMNGLWHYLLVPKGEIQLGLVHTVACGANPWLALINSSLESQPEGSEHAREIFSFLHAHEEYYEDAASVAEVGVLFSSATAHYYLSRFEDVFQKAGGGREEGLRADLDTEAVVDTSARKKQCEQMLMDACEGYFAALVRSHIPFDVVLDQDMTPEKLAQYRCVVLPDGACLSGEAATALRAYVEGGGALLASFESGFYDEKGDYTERLFDVLGIDSVEGAFPVVNGENYSESVADHWGYPEGRLIERGPYALKVRAGEGVEVRARFRGPVFRSYVPLGDLTEYPAVLVRRFGAGRVVYFPEAIGLFHGQSRILSAEHRIHAALRELLDEEPAIELDAPKTVSIDAYSQNGGSRLLLHLVNNTCDRHPVDEFVPVYGLRVRIWARQAPNDVFTLREGGDVSVAFAEGCIELTLDKLTMYEVLVVDMG